MDQQDIQRHSLNALPAVVIRLVPGSPLDQLLRTQPGLTDQRKRPYTTLDAVARQGSHAAVSRPI